MRVAGDAGWPQFSENPVHDWMVREALIRRRDALEQAAAEQAELDAKVKAAEQAVIDRVRGGRLQ